MIKLSKDDKDELLYALEYNKDTRGFPNNPNALHEQILDDYERARKWDKINKQPYHENTALALEQEIEKGKQNRKLRELIEEDLKDKDYRWDISYNRMLKLLEDSKK